MDKNKYSYDFPCLVILIKGSPCQCPDSKLEKQKDYFLITLDLISRFENHINLRDTVTF